MSLLKDKRGVALTTTIVVVMLIALGVFLVLIFGGGIAGAFSIFKALKSIPTWVWIALAGLFILWMFSGGRRR